MQIPKLTDGVVLLNGLSLRDAATQVAGEDEEMARRFGWYPKHSTVKNVRRFIRSSQQSWRRGGYRRTWATRDVETGALVGGCELRVRPGRVAHISYLTFPEVRGRGFATRAACLACDFAFASWGIDQLHAHIAPDNFASRGVAERSGFVEIGLVDATERRLARLANDDEMLLYVRLRPDPSEGIQAPQLAGH